MKELEVALASFGTGFEVIVVNDGSTDDTRSILSRLGQQYSWLEPCHVGCNLGKTAAIKRGFAVARGSFIVTLDADLQDNPQDIPKIVARLEDGADMVCGWRHMRTDTPLKRQVSKIANAISATFTGIQVHDMNCGVKGFRRVVVESIELRNDFHRFLHIVAHSKGFLVEEMKVDHRERRYGSSHYGSIRPMRLMRSAFDFLSIIVLLRFAERPFHLFGGVGLVFGFLGSGVLVYLAVLRLVYHQSIGGRPLLMLGVLLVITGVQLISLGVLGEIILNRRSS